MIRVLYVASGLCSKCGLAAELPKHLADAGVEIDVMVPHCDGIDEGAGRLARRLVVCEAAVDGNKREISVLEGRSEDHIRTFYLDDESLRSPMNLSSESGIYASAVFAQAVCCWIARGPVTYDVVHCEGLAAALIPTMMRTRCAGSDRIRRAKVIAAVAGIEDKGSIDIRWISRMGLPDALASSDGMEFYGKMSVLKGAYLYADAVCFANTCVKNHIENNVGKDIGMEGVLFDRLDKIHVIGLGVDTDHFDPKTDKDIEANYDADDMAGKAKCKAALTKAMRLGKDRPVVAFAGRLNADSGIDIVNDILDDLMDRRVNLVIAGTADGGSDDPYNCAVESWKQEFKGQVGRISHMLDDKEVRRLMSAADILLIPAKSESICRLHQIAMRYGCVVVARNQGAVANDLIRVRDIDHVAADENGFSCARYDSDEYFDAAMDALDLVSEKEWNGIRANAMRKIVSVKDTASDCIKIYDAVISK